MKCYLKISIPSMAQFVRIHLQCRRPWFSPRVRKIPWRRDRLPTPVFMGFPGGSDCTESACNAGDLGLIPGLGKDPRRGHGNPLQYSCLENPHGKRSLVGYSPGGHKESDMTEWLSTEQHMKTATMSIINILLVSGKNWKMICGLVFVHYYVNLPRGI